MATVVTRGFTVIELMLFLAITGAIFAALMIGVNNNITQQHYRESVQNYGAMLQNQYSEVANTRIERDSDLKCELDISGNVTVSTQSGEGDLPGAPSANPACVILGRAVQVANDGAITRIYPVVGLESEPQGSLSDIDTLVDYNPSTTDKFNASFSDIEWNSSLRLVDGQSSEASFLILRSPASGLIRVFASTDSLPADLSTIITPANAVLTVKNCMYGERGLLPIQSVTVNPKIAGPDGVIIKENDPECQ